MGTLYVDRKDLHIKLNGNALAFYSRGCHEGVVPVNPLKRVVIVGNVLIETPVLHKLASENVSVVFLSGKRLHFSGMLHGRLHQNGILRVRQYEKTLGNAVVEMAKALVERKLAKQRAFIEEAKGGRPDLGMGLSAASKTLERSAAALGDSAGLETIRGLEGAAAAAYFSAYIALFPSSLRFVKRTRRPPEDPVNALLSLCYTLLHYEMVREIEMIGLDSVIGFYHQFEYGRESLACDLIEPYRPDVDRLVYELFRTRQFAARDFSEDDDRPGCYLKKGGRKRFYPVYEEWARQQRRLWTEEARAFARWIGDGQIALSE